jgi:hypothetical protein
MTIFLATWETEIGGSRFKASLGKKLVRSPISTKKLGLVVYICNPSYVRGIGQWIVVCGRPRPKAHDPIPKYI